MATRAPTMRTSTHAPDRAVARPVPQPTLRKRTATLAMLSSRCRKRPATHPAAAEENGRNPASAVHAWLQWKDRHNGCPPRRHAPAPQERRVAVAYSKVPLQSRQFCARTGQPVVSLAPGLHVAATMAPARSTSTPAPDRAAARPQPQPTLRKRPAALAVLSSRCRKRPATHPAAAEENGRNHEPAVHAWQQWKDRHNGRPPRRHAPDPEERRVAVA